MVKVAIAKFGNGGKNLTFLKKFPIGDLGVVWGWRPETGGLCGYIIFYEKNCVTRK